MTTRSKPAQQADATARLLQGLAEAVERLADEVHVLRDVLGEVRDDLAWALHNDRLRPARPHVPVVPLTSMPLDPLAPDFGERLNRYGPQDLPAEMQAPPKASGRKARQQHLFREIREEGGE
jgi:hypothetical protein